MNNTPTHALRVGAYSSPTRDVEWKHLEKRAAHGGMFDLLGGPYVWIVVLSTFNNNRCRLTRLMGWGKLMFLAHCFVSSHDANFSITECYMTFRAKYFVGSWNQTFGYIVLINMCFSDQIIPTWMSVPRTTVRSVMTLQPRAGCCIEKLRRQTQDDRT